MNDGSAARFGLGAAVWISLAALAGGLVSLHLLRRGCSPWACMQRKRIERGTTLALLALLVASVAHFWLRAAAMAERDLFDAGAAAAVLTGTHVGRAAAAGFAALAAALLAGAWSRWRWSAQPAWAAACASAFVFATTRSAGGHAGASGSLPMLGADVLHVASTSVWAGLVLVAAASLPRAPWPYSAADRSDAVRHVHALSRAATGALALVLATGLVGIFRGIHGATAGLLATTWGAVLLLKLVFVGIAVQLGAHNRFAAMPRLDAANASSAAAGDRASAVSAALASFVAVIGIEAIVLLAAFLAATALGESSPPAEAAALLIFEPGYPSDETSVPS